MLGRKIYVASSWQSTQHVVKALREAGHEVSDFRNPAPGDDRFSWPEFDAGPIDWMARQEVDYVRRPVDDRGRDHDALHWCDTCVLALPCGRSGLLEAGYAAAHGKRVIFLLSQDDLEPELTCRRGHGFVADIRELICALQTPDFDYMTIL